MKEIRDGKELEAKLRAARALRDRAALSRLKSKVPEDRKGLVLTISVPEDGQAVTKD